METQPRSALIADADAPAAERLAEDLVRHGFQVERVGSCAEAVAAACRARFDLAVVELKFPDGDGLDLVDRLRRLRPATPVLVVTAWGAMAHTVLAMRRGARDVLPKPADGAQLIAALGGADAPGPSPPPRSLSLARLEWEHIQRILVETGGNKSEAARRLGLHRQSLQRKLRRRPPVD